MKNSIRKLTLLTTFVLASTMLSTEANAFEAPAECANFVNIYTSIADVDKKETQKSLNIYLNSKDVASLKGLAWSGLSDKLVSRTYFYTEWKKINMARQLIIASAKGDLRAVEGLIRLGATPDIIPLQDDWMPALVWASRCGRTKVVSKLLLHGADPNIGAYYITSQGIAQNSTSLRWASTYGFTKIMNILLKNGADPDGRETTTEITGPAVTDDNTAQTLHSGITPLIAAVTYSKCNEAATEILLRAGADANLAEESGRSPLILAALVGSKPCVDLLLKAGARVDHVDNAGTDAEEAARRGGFVDLADILHKAKTQTLVH